MPTTGPSSPGAGTGTASAGPVAGAKSPLSVSEGAPGLATETVRFPAGGSDNSAYLARPESGAPGPAVLICHENRGLTPHIEDVARRFAKTGYAALALDLLSREGGTATLDRDAVPGALTAAGAQRHVSDFAAAFDHLQSKDYVDSGRIAMTGYCFGGGITWQAATELTGLKATAAFYGPSPDLEKVPAIKPAVFGVYAELDQRITGALPALRDALAAACGNALAFAVNAVGVAVLFSRYLGAVPDQETGVTGKFVVCLRDDLDGQFLGNDFPARDHRAIQRIRLIQLTHHTAGVGGVRGLQGLEGPVLRFLDVGTNFIVIGCHGGDSLFFGLLG
jgi:dienelactone hydrolase